MRAGRQRGDHRAECQARPRAGALFRARSLATKRDIDAAVKIVDAVIARSPSDPEALTLKGDLLRVSGGDASAATEMYRKALSVKPRHLLRMWRC